MPGALDGRTSSLEPSPEPDWEKIRFVRFNSGLASPAGQQAAAVHSHEASSPAVTNRRPAGTPAPRHHDSKESHAVSRSSSPNASPSPLVQQPQMSDEARRASKGKGKERQVFVEDEPEDLQSAAQDSSSSSSVDVSFETQVRGKERELSVVKQIERNRDPYTPIDIDDREQDKQRIKTLEREIRNLREEVRTQ